MSYKLASYEKRFKFPFSLPCERPPPPPNYLLGLYYCLPFVKHTSFFLLFIFDEVSDASYVNSCQTNMNPFGKFATAFLFTWISFGLKFPGCFGKAASLLAFSVFELTLSVVDILAKAAFTRQTNVGQLVLANSNWCV